MTEENDAYLGELISKHLQLKRRLVCLTGLSEKLQGQLKQTAREIGEVSSGQNKETPSLGLPSQESIYDVVKQIRETYGNIADTENQIRNMGYSEYIPARNQFVSR